MSHPIPDAALDSDIAIIARKGSGKTYLARGLVERLLDLGRRVVIVDPLGSWWGLKASADGEREGYPVAVFGGDHGDMPLTDKMGEPLGRLIAEENFPCVIDTSLMRKEEQGRLAIDLFETLFRLNKEPLTVVLEEADVFAPQNPPKDGYAAQVLHEVDRIARRGRARGLRLITLTQRPARLHKDVLSQAAALVAMRLTSPHDREAMDDWIKGNADAAAAAEVKGSLVSLPVGTGWVWAPDLGMLERVAFPQIKTLDTSATPKAGERRIEPKTLAEVDVSAIRAALAVEEPEQVAKSAKTSGVDLAEAFERGRLGGLLEGDRQGWERAIAAVRAVLHPWTAPGATAKAPPEPVLPTPPLDAPKVAEVPARPPAPGRNAVADDLLQAAVDIYPVTVPFSVLAAMTGRKARGGSFNVARKALLDSGRVKLDGDRVVPANMVGGAFSPVPAADRLEDSLPTVPGRIFKTIRNKPGITVEEIGGALGIATRGGSWNVAMALLRDARVIYEEGGKLFIPAALEGKRP